MTLSREKCFKHGRQKGKGRKYVCLHKNPYLFHYEFSFFSGTNTFAGEKMDKILLETHKNDTHGTSESSVDSEKARKVLDTNKKKNRAEWERKENKYLLHMILYIRYLEHKKVLYRSMIDLVKWIQCFKSDRKNILSEAKKKDTNKIND